MIIEQPDTLCVYRFKPNFELVQQLPASAPFALSHDGRFLITATGACVHRVGSDGYRVDAYIGDLTTVNLPFVSGSQTSATEIVTKYSEYQRTFTVQVTQAVQLRLLASVAGFAYVKSVTGPSELLRDQNAFFVPGSNGVAEITLQRPHSGNIDIQCVYVNSFTLNTVEAKQAVDHQVSISADGTRATVDGDTFKPTTSRVPLYQAYPGYLDPPITFLRDLQNGQTTRNINGVSAWDMETSQGIGRNTSVSQFKLRREGYTVAFWFRFKPGRGGTSLALNVEFKTPLSSNKIPQRLLNVYGGQNLRIWKNSSRDTSHVFTVPGLTAQALESNWWCIVERGVGHSAATVGDLRLYRADSSQCYYESTAIYEHQYNQIWHLVRTYMDKRNTNWFAYLRHYAYWNVCLDTRSLEAWIETTRRILSPGRDSILHPTTHFMKWRVTYAPSSTAHSYHRGGELSLHDKHTTSVDPAHAPLGYTSVTPSNFNVMLDGNAGQYNLQSGSGPYTFTVTYTQPIELKQVRIGSTDGPPQNSASGHPSSYVKFEYEEDGVFKTHSTLDLKNTVQGPSGVDTYNTLGYYPWTAQQTNPLVGYFGMDIFRWDGTKWYHNESYGTDNTQSYPKTTDGGQTLY